MNMPNPVVQKKEMLVLYQGPRRRRSVEIKLDRRVHTAFTGVVGADGNVPSKGVYKIRAGEQNPLRVAARRCVEAHDANAPVERVLAVAEEFRQWILTDLYGKAAS